MGIHKVWELKYVKKKKKVKRKPMKEACAAQRWTLSDPALKLPLNTRKIIKPTQSM